MKNRNRCLSLVLYVFLTFVVASMVHAETEVIGRSAIVSSDTTWTASGSPYNIKSSILIMNGATLTIEAGVEVAFTSGGLGMIIQGELIARGTSDAKIYFGGGDWNNIIFDSGSEGAAYDNDGNYQSGSILEHCVIQNTGVDNTGAIECKNNAVPYINHCDISGNEGAGLYVNSSANPYCKIENSTISNNTDNGVYIYHASTVTVVNCSIDGNGSYGVYISDASTASVDNCTINSNSTYGVSISSAITASVDNCTISSNGFYGVSISSATTASVANCTINSSSTVGVSISYSKIASVYNCTINSNGSYGVNMYYPTTASVTYCNITSNGSFGVYIDGGTTINMTGNTYNNNVGGLKTQYVNTVNINGDIFSSNTNTYGAGALHLEWIQIAEITNCTFDGNAGSGNNIYVRYTGNNPSVKINQCNLLDTSGYQIYNDNAFGTPDIDATNNWWGTADESQILDKIYDFFDNSEKGFVTYYPFLTGAVSGATGTITGTVTDSDTGSGVSGATVSTNTGGHSTTTGSSGGYTLGGVSEGTYTVTASSDSYESNSQSTVSVSAGLTTTVDLSLTPSATVSCTYTLSPTDITFDSLGGGGDISVTTSSDCEWTATSEVSWVSITTNDSGVGDGTVSYAVDTNLGTSLRTGAITIEDRDHTITQTGVGCEYTISPMSKTFDPSGGTGNVGVTTRGECDWTVNSNASWIVLTSNASGVGNGTISYTVLTNTSAISRSGTITIVDRTYTVIQEGQTPGECTYALSSTGKNFDSLEGTGSVTVITLDGCEWFATSRDSWIEILTGTIGTGTDTINYSVSENTSANDRTGTITIVGSNMTLAFNVSQGFTTCEYTLSSTNKAFGFEEGIGNIRMTTSSDCRWTATSNDSWITIISGYIGDGDGTISFSVRENTGGDRTGTIDIIGSTTSVTFTVTQEERPECDISISSANKDFGCDGGTGFIDVDPEQSGCDWTASSTDSWITITSGSSGTGSGTVIYSVLSVETSVSREGQIIVAGKTFTVSQICDADCEFTLSSNNKEFDLQGGTDSVFVTTGSDCFWTAASNNSWITIISGSSGTGSGSATYSVSGYTGTGSRTGTMTIAGETFTVTQNEEGATVLGGACTTYDPVTEDVYIPSLDAGALGSFEVLLEAPYNIKSLKSVTVGSDCKEASYDFSTEEVHMPTIDAGALGTFDIILAPPYNIVSLIPK